jgi:non-ribosomal peptide synthetase component E (peptide arylation enzyme)
VPTRGRAPELEALRLRLREQGLAPFKLPEKLLLLDSLPLVGDKVDRRALFQFAYERRSS